MKSETKKPTVEQEKENTSTIYVRNGYNAYLLDSFNKCLANAKRPFDCSVLCVRPKHSLCSCPYSILDMTSFGSTVRIRDQGRDSVQQRGRSV